MLMSLKKDTKYKLNIKRQSDKYLMKLSKNNKKEFKILLECIKNLPENPYDSKPLHNNLKGLRRLRKGEYRIIFRIDESIITILNVGKRANLYKKR